MAKLLVLLVGVAMTWGLVASLGWIAIVACFVIALATVMFSIEVDEQDIAPVGSSMEVSQQSL
jgi:predicted histidine transporter YuiF (NhaC family)